MAVTPVNQTLTVAAAGTRIQVTSDTAVTPTSFYIEALGTNTGYIYVGLSDVSSTKYIARLSAGQAFSAAADHIGNSASGKASISHQLSNYYVDCSVSGEKAQLAYLNGG